MSVLNGTASLRVMLVDDHPVVLAGYRRLLELEPDIVVVAEHNDVDSALSMIERAGTPMPHVLVTDLAMPRRGGLELLREVRLRFPAIRVLVFSMHDSPAVLAEALRSGAAGFVTKASAPHELVQSIRHVAVQPTPVLSSDLAAREVQGPDAECRPLTRKELDVLRLLSTGETVFAIADALGLSPKTVSNYQTSLKRKFEATTTVDLLRSARDRGYVD